MDKKEELTQIVKKVQKDIGQFELLYSHIISKIYYWCYTVVRDEAVAKDLAQESMIRIYQKINTVNNAETFHSWMYVLVRNICYRYVESHRKSDTVFIESEDYSDYFENTIEDERIENIPNESYNLKETKDLIISFIENLPVKQREIIMMFYLEEFTINEITEILECKSGTVKSHLHNGRKNLEKQINDYQAINNIKLYSSVVLPMIGSILQDHSDSIISNQDLSYSKDFNSKQDFNKSKDINNNQKLNSNQGIQNVSKLSKVTKLKSAVTLNVSTFTSMAAVVTATAIVATVAIVAVVIAVQNNSDSEVINAISDEPKVNEVNIEEKIKGNPYIENITYYTFPTRESTPVNIKLKKDISSEEIVVIHRGEELEFNKKDGGITIIATENGEYNIIINKEELDFYISTIDEYAPEVESVQRNTDYLQLIINDEKSTINYEKSYVEYKNKKYQITKDKQVFGDFKGDINIYIYNNHNQYISYEVNI